MKWFGKRRRDGTAAAAQVTKAVDELSDQYYDGASIEDGTQFVGTPGYPVRDQDAARLSAYQRKHINVHGHYSFQRPDLSGQRRPLRGYDAHDAE